jgi:hypothetical protein
MIEAEELKQVPIFACLTDAQRVRLAQSAAELHVQEGEWLIREGDGSGESMARQPSVP